MRYGKVQQNHAAQIFTVVETCQLNRLKLFLIFLCEQFVNTAWLFLLDYYLHYQGNLLTRKRYLQTVYVMFLDYLWTSFLVVVQFLVSLIWPSIYIIMSQVLENLMQIR